MTSKNLAQLADGNIHKEDLELEKQLKLVNKPSVKSIHTKFGYIVDCIDINKQPAFDHPLLKNHKLQLKPSLQKSSRETIVKNSTVKSIFGLHKVQCPTGTVPIRRILKDDLIRSKLFNNHILTQEKHGYHYADVFLKPEYAPYYGVSGTNSVYNPIVLRSDQFTSSHLRVQNGPIQAADQIRLGWHVAPQLYGGDEGTYLFSSWDKRTKNWWVSIQNENIGYFPATLFSNMSSGDYVGWGGETITPPGTPSPQMGSGYLPDRVFVHACYFRNVAIQSEPRISYGPPDSYVATFKDKPDCFDALYYGNLKHEVGYSLQFGGPGGVCGD
ncbi:hypothetical protein Fmac_031248 [Flemingia macrophylla]|uniref:Neprosin PEP catalytic domain-containing protein n=1 Tax=Flemingia macrophylla TaxID=520843 RepID=A0ABD1L1I4_9FABA